MNLAFALFKYFPYGGLQMKALNIAKACVRGGHQVTLYTTSWQGSLPSEFKVEFLIVKGWSNHRRYLSFSQEIKRALSENPADLLIGFHKLPELDIYYAGDSCFAVKAYEDRPSLYRWTPRCRQLLALERAVFDKQSTTKILLLSEPEREYFQRYYQTPSERFFILPPGIPRQRIMSDDFLSQRRTIRKELQLPGDESMLLALGGGFKIKGLDRSIEMLSLLPEQLKTRLVVVGQDNPHPFQKLAKKHGVIDRVMFLSGRDDVSSILQAADVLLHPAYKGNAGNVLLEALIAGLPVIVTDVCGYAPYIQQAQMGEVLSSPFSQQAYCRAIENVLAVPRDMWRQRGKQFAMSADIYDLPERAKEIIESIYQSMHT